LGRKLASWLFGWRPGCQFGQAIDPGELIDINADLGASAENQVMVAFRLATFNVENLGAGAEHKPPLAERIRVLQPELLKLDFDVLCLQEVNAEPGGGARSLEALDQLLAGTRFAAFHRAVTLSDSGRTLRDVHNLVILSRFPILEQQQIAHALVPPLQWRPLAALPPAPAASPVRFDRPLLYAKLDLGSARHLHVINLHLRAPLPAFIQGQKLGPWKWKSIPGFAEGLFLAELKRAGQALEARLFIERIFERETDPLIAVAGDFNAKSGDLTAAIIQAPAIETGNAELAARALTPVEASIPKARRFSVRHGGERLMLDHLMVSKALASGLTGVEVLNDDLADELVAYVLGQHPAAGCHAPLVASFDLAGAVAN
jgi:endonuclease/exonuclease/phosphatase family metal-dependent hydrolase